MQLRGLKPNMIVLHVTTQTLYRITRVNIGCDNIVSHVTAADAGGNAITIDRYHSLGDGTFHPRYFKRTSVRPEDIWKLNWKWRGN